MAEFVRVADIQEIPPGRGKLFHIRGREIALFNAEGTFYAVKSTCPHRGVSLDRGIVEQAIVTCPGHGWRFDLRNGESISHPPAGLRCYRVDVRDSSVWIAIPEPAEPAPGR